MQLLEWIGPAGSTASVGAALLGWYVWRDGKRDKAIETRRQTEAERVDLQRKVDRAEQTKAIQAAIGGLSDKVDQRFDGNDELTKKNTERIQRLEDEQFGPNHGGARQAINETAADVKGIVASLAKMDTRLVRVETVVFPPVLAPTA